MSNESQSSTSGLIPSSVSDSAAGPNLDACARHLSLIWTAIRKCRYTDEYPDFILDFLRQEELCRILAACRDEKYLSLHPDVDSSLAAEAYPILNREPDMSLYHHIVGTPPEIRIGMIIWVAITWLHKNHFKACSDYDKWDVQGRAITLWADTFCEVVRSKKRPSGVIATNKVALAAFQSAMERDGHQHDYRMNSDVAAWVTMRAVLFPELEHLPCFHWNDEDRCPSCHARLDKKIHSDIGQSPPLYLVALWHCLFFYGDFEEKMAFAAAHQPKLFLPKMVEPVQDFLAQRYPEQVRRAFYLHNRQRRRPPSWERLQDTINSFCHVGTWGRSFPAIQPTLWFATVLLLVHEDEHLDRNTRGPSRTSDFRDVEWLGRMNLYEQRLPLLNLCRLPKDVRRVVKRFCRATEGSEHTCHYIDNVRWNQMDVESLGRYAAAHALLYGTDVIPLLDQRESCHIFDCECGNTKCDSCENIRRLSKRVDQISAGHIRLNSNDMAQVVGFIDELAAESSESSEDSESDGGGSSDDQETKLDDYTEDLNTRQRGESTENQETILDNDAMRTNNEMNHHAVTTSTDPEVGQGDSVLTRVHKNPLLSYITTVDANGFIYLPLDPAAWTVTDREEDVPHHTRAEMQNYQEAIAPDISEHLLQRDMVPTPLSLNLGENVHSGVAPEANWSDYFRVNRQTSDSMASNRPTDDAGMKTSKSAKKQRKELHAFFVTLFEKHGILLETTNNGAAKLPWKNMKRVLARDGLELTGWPSGVPEPGSDYAVDKGIEGFNAEHTAALYKVMKAGQLDFQPLAGGSKAPLVRQREDGSGDELDVRPSKKGKLAERRKKPKAMLDMSGVMKLSDMGPPGTKR
ncbi:hypothetical protein B0H19DRAFT_1131652 [Mycena capillaripes]|nr:hypothetical protein B0H19DRAFT_1131652 [Mycena capillaripes]